MRSIIKNRDWSQRFFYIYFLLMLICKGTGMTGGAIYNGIVLLASIFACLKIISSFAKDTSPGRNSKKEGGKKEAGDSTGDVRTAGDKEKKRKDTQAKGQQPEKADELSDKLSDDQAKDNSGDQAKENKKAENASDKVSGIAAEGTKASFLKPILSMIVSFALLLLGVIVWRTSGDQAVVWCILAVLVMKDMDPGEVLSFGGIVWAVCLVFQILTQLFDLRTRDFVIHQRFGMGYVIRWALGYAHPNVLQIAFVVLLMYFIGSHELRRRRSVVYFVLLSLAGALYIFLYSLSTTGMLMYLAFIFFLVLSDLIRRKEERRREERKGQVVRACEKAPFKEAAQEEKIRAKDKSLKKESLNKEGRAQTEKYSGNDRAFKASRGAGESGALKACGTSLRGREKAAPRGEVKYALWEKVLLQLILPACAGISVLGPVLLKGRAFDLVNRLMTTRPALSRFFMTTYGMSLFGQRFDGLSAEITMDCSYVDLLMRGGVILFVIMLLAYAVTIYRLLHMTRTWQTDAFLAIIFTCLFAGISEPFLFNTAYKNVSLLIVGAVLLNGRQCTLAEEKKTAAYAQEEERLNAENSGISEEKEDSADKDKPDEEKGKEDRKTDRKTDKGKDRKTNGEEIKRGQSGKGRLLSAQKFVIACICLLIGAAAGIVTGKSVSVPEKYYCIKTSSDIDSDAADLLYLDDEDIRILSEDPKVRILNYAGPDTPEIMFDASMGRIAWLEKIRSIVSAFVWSVLVSGCALTMIAKRVNAKRSRRQMKNKE